MAAPVYLLAGTLFLAMSGALVVARRGHAPAVALAVYVGSLGLVYAMSGIAGELREGVVPATLSWVAQFAAAGALTMLALIFPRPIEGRARVDGWIAGAYGIVFVLLLAWLGGASAGVPALGEVGWHAFLGWLGSRAIAAASIATGLLLPLRARRLGAHEGAAMRAIGIIAVALFLLSPGGPWPGIVRAAQGEFGPARSALVVVNVLVPVVAWIAATTGEQSRGSRNTFLALVALNLGLGAIHQITGDLVVQIGRLFSALFLTYAVIAGQIDGLDLKIRFAISRSTVAGVFIAVFFIVAESAQQFFGETTQSAYLGIAAAGALVFALAPLQRAAERLAERAVPVTGPAAVSTPAATAEEAYRRALRLAWKDRALTPEEEVHLFHVAEALGVPAGRAMELRHEVERDTRSGEVSS